MSGATSEPDSSFVFPAAEADDAAEQPGVVFHCEEGRLRAYLVPSGVPIILDSAPRC